MSPSAIPRSTASRELSAEPSDATTTKSSSYTRTVTLSTIEEAPIALRLLHAICLPCRNVGSKCEQHDNYTTACIQCRKRQTDCKWAVKNRGIDLTTGRERYCTDIDNAQRFKRRRIASDNGSDGNEETDRNVTSSQRYSRQTTRSVTPSKRARSKSREAIALSTKVPSAGWAPLRLQSRTIAGVKDLKGKGKVKQETVFPSSIQTEVPKNETDTKLSEDEEDDQADVDQDETPKDNNSADTIKRMLRSGRGQHFLETSDYASLLASIFAEDSTDLARNLYWWEFSPQAQYLRQRRPDISRMQKTDLPKLTYLDVLLAENACLWTLFPRLTQLVSPQLALFDSKIMHKQPSLPEEISALITLQLQQSGVLRRSVAEMHPIQLGALRDSYLYYADEIQKDKAKLRHPSTAAARAQNPYLTRTEYREKYLDADDLLLDYTERLETPITMHTLQILQSTLLYIAQCRKPIGPRSSPPWVSGRVTTDTVTSAIPSQERHANMPNSAAEDQAESSKAKHDTGNKHPRPADWKVFLLAAMSIPGISRRYVSLSSNFGDVRSLKYVTPSL